MSGGSINPLDDRTQISRLMTVLISKLLKSGLSKNSVDAGPTRGPVFALTAEEERRLDRLLAEGMGGGA